MSQPSKHELVQQAVESGAVSGIYYVLVANLPPEMNFADLKFLSRKVASVDKCFINVKTSEGWVRVRSQHDFFKVYHHLNGLDYKGYILSASADNSSRSVYIWDQKKSRSSANTSPSSRRAGAASLSPYTSAASTLDYGHYGPRNEGTSLLEYNSCHSYDSGYSSGASSSSGYPHAGEQAAQTVTAMAPDFTSSQQYEGADGSSGSWYPHYSSGTGVDYSYGYGYGHQADSASGDGAPQTAKVVVKNLSRHASTKELESYLLSAVGGRHMLQEDVRFPRQTSTSSNSSSSSSASRQHAFLLFNSHSDALMAVSKLDKTKLLGLVIEARLATEMVLPIRGLPSSTSSYVPPIDAQPTSNSSDIDTVAGTADCNKDGGSAASGHWNDSKTKRDKSHNLVVDGKSVYGHVKKAVEETKARDRKHKHRK